MKGRELIALGDLDKPAGLVVVYVRSFVQLAAKHPGADAIDLEEDDMSAAGAQAGGELHSMSDRWAGAYAVVELLASQKSSCHGEYAAAARRRACGAVAANVRVVCCAIE